VTKRDDAIPPQQVLNHIRQLEGSDIGGCRARRSKVLRYSFSVPAQQPDSNDENINSSEAE